MSNNSVDVDFDVFDSMVIEDEKFETSWCYCCTRQKVPEPERKIENKPKKPNGGWGDLRDRNLCYFLVDHVDPSSLRLSQLPFLQ